MNMASMKTPWLSASAKAALRPPTSLGLTVSRFSRLRKVARWVLYDRRVESENWAGRPVRPWKPPARERPLTVLPA